MMSTSLEEQYASLDSSQIYIPDRIIIPNIVEKNAHRQEREIYLKSRPLRNVVQQKGIKAIGKPFAFLDPLCHWAIQVGDYTHEIIVDRSGNSKLLSYVVSDWQENSLFLDENASRRSKYKINKIVCGTSTLTDSEICYKGGQIFEQFKITGGTYDAIANNCQRFAHKLAMAITADSRKAKIQCAYFMVTKTMPIERFVAMGATGVAFIVVAVLSIVSQAGIYSSAHHTPLSLFFATHPLPQLLLAPHFLVSVLSVSGFFGLRPMIEEGIEKVQRETEFRKEYPLIYNDIFGRRNLETKALHKVIMVVHKVLSNEGSDLKVPSGLLNRSYFRRFFS